MLIKRFRCCSLYSSRRAPALKTYDFIASISEGNLRPGSGRPGPLPADAEARALSGFTISLESTR